MAWHGKPKTWQNVTKKDYFFTETVKFSVSAKMLRKLFIIARKGFFFQGFIIVILVVQS